MLLAAASSLDEDRKIGSFNHPLSGEISFLAKDPQTTKEIAENLFERLRAAGVEVQVTWGDFDESEIRAVHQIRQDCIAEDD